MSLQITILNDKKTSKEEAFSVLENYEVRHKLLAEVLRSEAMNLRSGNAHTKTRGEVSGGGKKPWKQKGTGRARHGSSRSPIWVGGGVTFGPRSDRNWHCKINKTARLSALKSLIKDRLVEDAVYQLAGLDFSKTKEAILRIENLVKDKTLKIKDLALVYTTEEKNDTLGFSNLDLKKVNAKNIKLTHLANSKLFLLTPESRKFLEERVLKNK